MPSCLRAGDNVAVQVMRTPRGVRSLYDDMWPVGSGRDWSKCPSAPLLSNRLEFTVTAEMLR